MLWKTSLMMMVIPSGLRHLSNPSSPMRCFIVTRSLTLREIAAHLSQNTHLTELKGRLIPSARVIHHNSTSPTYFIFPCTFVPQTFGESRVMDTCFKEGYKYNAVLHLEMVMELWAPPGCERTAWKEDGLLSFFHIWTFAGSVRTSQRMFYYSDQTLVRLISRHSFVFHLNLGCWASGSLLIETFVNNNWSDIQDIKEKKVFFWRGDECQWTSKDATA